MFFVSLLSAGYRSSPSMEWDKMHCPQLSEVCLHGSRTPKLVVVADSSPVTNTLTRFQRVTGSSPVWLADEKRLVRRNCPVVDTRRVGSFVENCIQNAEQVLEFVKRGIKAIHYKDCEWRTKVRYREAFRNLGDLRAERSEYADTQMVPPIR